MNTELKSLLLTAEDEIRRLRQYNEILRAKVDTMEVFRLALTKSEVYPPMTMSPDVTWQIQKYIADNTPVSEGEK